MIRQLALVSEAPKSKQSHSSCTVGRWGADEAVAAARFVHAGHTTAPGPSDLKMRCL